MHKDNDDNNKTKLVQKQSSNSADVNAPPTYPPLNSGIMETFYDLRPDMKELKFSQMQTWELFKVDFTAKPTYM